MTSAQSATLRGTLLATICFVTVSAMAWWILGGWETARISLLWTLALSPLLWWWLVSRHARPGLIRGIVGGAITGLVTQWGPSARDIWQLFSSRGHSYGEGGIAAIGAAAAYLLIGIWAFALGGLLGLVVVAFQRRVGDFPPPASTEAGRQRSMASETWLPTVLMVVCMGAIAEQALGGLWTVGVVMSALVLAPVLWWRLVARRAGSSLVRGALVGALVGAAANGLPLLLVLGWQGGRAASRAGQADGFATFDNGVMLGFALGGASVGAAVGAMLGVATVGLRRVLTRLRPSA